MESQRERKQQEVLQLTPDEPTLSEQLRDEQWRITAIEPDTRTQWFHMAPPAREGWYEAHVRPFEDMPETNVIRLNPEETVMAYFRDHWIMDQRCIQWLIPLDEAANTWQEVYCSKWRGLAEFPAQPWKLEEPAAVLKRFNSIQRDDVYYMHRLEIFHKQQRGW